MRALAVLALFFCATPAAAQWTVEVRPAALRSNDRWLPAARVGVEGRGTRIALTERPREHAWNVLLDLPLTWNKRDNPEALRLTADYGWEKSLKRIQRDLSVDDTGLPPINWGYLRAQAGVDAETHQTLDLGVATANAVLAYEHDERRIWYVPAVRVSFGAAACIDCGGEEVDYIGKLDSTVGWNVPIDRLVLRARVRAFVVMGEAETLRDRAEPNGLAGTVELAYRGRAEWAREVFVRWSSGKSPVLAQRRTWALGVALQL